MTRPTHLSIPPPTSLHEPTARFPTRPSRRTTITPNANPEALALDGYLPACNVTEVHTAVIDADVATTWNAIRHGNLAASLVIRTLLNIRHLPNLLQRRLTGRQPSRPYPPFTLDDMAQEAR